MTADGTSTLLNETNTGYWLPLLRVAADSTTRYTGYLPPAVPDHFRAFISMTPFPRQLIHGKKIGIALGSGSARGLAHVGILEALQDCGIQPTIVCGTSIGALVGACYVTGHIQAFSAWAGNLSTTDVFRFMNVRVWASGGFADATRLIQHLRTEYGDPNIESLDHAFAVVTTDLHRGREIWLQEGPIWSAVRASIAIPGVLTPVQHNDRWLVDGGLVNPIPVSVCRALGADIVIAVNLNSDLVGRRQHPEPALPPIQPEEEALIDEAAVIAAEEEGDPNLLGRISASLRGAAEPMLHLWNSGDTTDPVPGTLNVMLSAINIMQDRITRSRLAGEPADVILAPRLADMGFLEFNRGAEAIAEGRACVERMLPAIEHALALA